MKKYILLAFVFFVLEGVKAQVQTLKKPLSKKTIQALPETFVVLDTATYNQLLQKSEELKEQKVIVEALVKEATKNAEKNALNAELAIKLNENQKIQIELMQQEIESLKKQLAEKIRRSK